MRQGVRPPAAQVAREVSTAAAAEAGTLVHLFIPSLLFRNRLLIEYLIIFNAIIPPLSNLLPPHRSAAKTNFPAKDYINAVADAKRGLGFIVEVFETFVTQKNMMSGREFQERYDTPYFCSPASESYWSM